jgi:hypothetical protein
MSDILRKKLHAEYMRKYRKKNLQKMRILDKQQREKHKEKKSISKKKSYQKNREHYIKKALKYEEENKEKVRAYRKEYYARSDVRKRYNDRYNYRMINDPIFRFKQRMRQRLIEAVKSQNAKKSKRTIEYLGCTLAYLMGYIEGQFTQGMNWENYGLWHIDHIKPIALFDLSKEKEREHCFHYTNLQPLWAKENMMKGTRIA